MMLKRLLCLVLAVLMCLSICACGEDKGDPTDSTPTDTQPTETTEPGEDTVKYDFGGRTIKIAVWYEPEVPVLGNSDSEDAWYYSLKHAAEEFNCEVEWVIANQDAHFNTFVQKSLSGESYADILMCHSWNYISLIKQGLLAPTTEYINNASDKDVWNTTTYCYEGENYGVKPIDDPYWPAYTFLINTKILNELGLEHPQELARRGEWTWDKFREYCRMATDPSKEQYGVGCFMLPHLLCSGNNFDYAVPDENGVWQNGFTYEGTKNAGMELLELIEKMSQEDKSILGTWCDGVEAMQETANAFKDGKLLFAFCASFEEIKSSGFEDYSVVTVPQGPSSTGLKDTVQAFAFWCLPTESEFTAEERAAFWMEALRTWDPADEEGYYERDIDDLAELYRFKYFQNIEDVYFMFEMGENMTLEAASNVSWGSLVADDLYGAIIRGDTTPAAIVEELAGEMQSLIDATYNN